MIFDAHLDLAMNALEWNRDLTQPLSILRQREVGLTDKPDRGRGTVCLPEMRRGRIGLCVATQIARHVKPGNRLPGWHSPEQAWAQTQGQLAWYRALEARGELVQIKNLEDLERHLRLWDKSGSGEEARPPATGADARGQMPPPTPPAEPVKTGQDVDPSGAGLPIGYILSLEGADSIVTLKHLPLSFAQGLRALGPAHYGPGTYAQGTDATGGLGPRGLELLAGMDQLGIILDVTHLCDESFWEALDHFHGPVWASHTNCRALTPHPRQFTDEQIRALTQRGAVIGAALDAWMLVPGWIKGQTRPEAVGLKLERVVEHIDHVCQVAGNARHAGIGSDLDGAFGREQSPADLDSIADLARIPELLRARGYSAADVAAIAHGNFVRFLREAWSQ
ncbi:MAG: membrane dipeptidase [Verrucomicrobia bacterium]|nr:membrane dipeptidase [Verrucomicrobiota bacterium]